MLLDRQPIRRYLRGTGSCYSAGPNEFRPTLHAATAMTHPAVLVDAHVHVYPAFDTALLLESAAVNFARNAAARGMHADAFQGVLLLAETAACNWFDTVFAAGGWSDRGWNLVTVPDDEISLLAQGPAGQKLLLIAGRQAATAEGLEVLSLCSRARIADRQSLDRTLDLALDGGAVVVVPWAVGKWLGRRGQLVQQALARHGQRIFAGDNGGRPRAWPRPALFAASERLERPVLSGTDPLPLPGEERCVGRYGVVLDGALPENRPGLALRDRLLAATTQNIRPFGQLETVSNFFLNQVMLRLR
jgi:hypothetical protein